MLSVWLDGLDAGATNPSSRSQNHSNVYTSTDFRRDTARLA